MDHPCLPYNGLYLISVKSWANKTEQTKFKSKIDVQRTLYLTVGVRAHSESGGARQGGVIFLPEKKYIIHKYASVDIER